MKLPIGRFGSFRPALARRIARATALTASSWPISRLCSVSSSRTSRCASCSVILDTGMPVHWETTWLMSSSVTVSRAVLWARFHSARFSSISRFRFRSWSRRAAAFSKSWCEMASFFSITTASSRFSCSRTSGGAVHAAIRTRLAASSIRSIALSGRYRSGM